MNLKDILGYREDSPYKEEPFLNIKTKEGKITMKDVNKPLIGIDENGFVKVMYPGGEYQFTSNNVTEVPLFQAGGTYEEYQSQISKGKVSPLISFDVWKSQQLQSNLFMDDSMSNPAMIDNSISNNIPFSGQLPPSNMTSWFNNPSENNLLEGRSNVIKEPSLDITPKTVSYNPSSNTEQSNLPGLSNPFSNIDNLNLPIPQPIDSLDRPVLKEEKANSLFDYLASATPYIGSGISLEDRFRILGRSLNFDSSSIKDPHLQTKADNVNTGIGIAAGLSGLLGSARATLSGAGYQNKTNQFYNQYFKDQRDLQKRDYRYLFEDGGKYQDIDITDLKPEDIMLNNLIVSLPYILEENANAEIEGGEHVIQDNSVKKAVGPKHEDGGIKTVLQNGDLVISDHLELNNKSKVVNEEFGINTTENSTYSEAILKYKKKIKYDKVEDELKGLYKKLTSLNQLNDENTKELNIMLLQHEIEEKLAEKAVLDSDLLRFAEKMYSIQEKSKDTKIFKNGGKYIEALAEKHGISILEAQEVLKKYQTGGEALDIEQLIQQYAIMQGLNPQQVISQLQQMSESQRQKAIEQMQQTINTAPQTFQDGGTNLAESTIKNWNSFSPYEYSVNSLPQMKERLKLFAKEWNTEDVIPEIDKASSLSELNIIAGNLQDVVKNSPEIAKDYGTKTAPTRKGLQYLLDNNLISEKELKDNGVQVVNGKVTTGSANNPKLDSIKSLVNKSLENNTDKAQDYAVANFNDREWYYRYPARKTVEFTDQAAYDNFVKDKTKVNGEYYSIDNAPGLYIKPILKKSETKTDAPVNTIEKTAEITHGTPIKDLNLSKNQGGFGWLLMPDAVNLPPDPVFPHVKREFRTDYVDPMAVSPDQQLVEIQRIQNAQNQVLNYLPDNMKGANTANNTALLIQEASKAIASANTFNAQNAQQVEQLNTQLDNQDELYRYNEIPRYEELQLTALEKSKNDLYNYFNTIYNNQMDKIKYNNSINLIDGMNDNITYDIFGNPIVDKNTYVPFSKIPN